MRASGKWVTFSEKAEPIESEKRILEYILDIGYWRAFPHFWYVQPGLSIHTDRECGIKNDRPENESNSRLGGALLREQSL
jgi:hypothetical protein